jgi:flagellar assembly protein FliH
MLKTSLEVRPENVLGIIREALNALPYVTRPARLIVHPDDAILVRQELDEELDDLWQVVEDRTMERGGCCIETGANQIDASNATRWKRIAEALSSNQEWLP